MSGSLGVGWTYGAGGFQLVEGGRHDCGCVVIVRCSVIDQVWEFNVLYECLVNFFCWVKLNMEGQRRDRVTPRAPAESAT